MVAGWWFGEGGKHQKPLPHVTCGSIFGGNYSGMLFSMSIPVYYFCNNYSIILFSKKLFKLTILFSSYSRKLFSKKNSSMLLPGAPRSTCGFVRLSICPYVLTFLIHCALPQVLHGFVIFTHILPNLLDRRYVDIYGISMGNQSFQTFPMPFRSPTKPLHFTKEIENLRGGGNRMPRFFKFLCMKMTF